MADFDKSQYKVKRLFKDEGFENGLYIVPLARDDDKTIPFETWKYNDSKEAPSWKIIQHYSRYCLWEDRKDMGSDYIIADNGGSKEVVYNPEEKSLRMTLDARKVYQGKSKNYKYWPHLLIDQRDICDYKNMPEGDEKRFYSANSDKICVEYDIRLLDFVPTNNPEDVNACSFVAYAYLILVDANWIYFGYSPFDNRGKIPFMFRKETGGNNHIYTLTTEQVFGSVENSMCPVPFDVKPSEEWKHVEVNLTPHIDRIMEAANRDNIFGRPVTRDEFYFSGTNMGFEIYGNFSCTMEIKNYNLVSYIKKEEE